MKQANQSFNSAETTIIADRILRNYKRDRFYFENYSPKFDNEFLFRFEEGVNTLVNLTPLQTLENEISKKTEKTQIIINHFIPLVNITEKLLNRAEDDLNLGLTDFGINELRESVNRRCTTDIQKDCHKMVSALEDHIDQLIDKGFIIRILNDFHVLMDKLKNVEHELADVTYQYESITDKYLMTDSQLENFIYRIIESTPAVFGEKNIDKIKEYSIEKLMTEAQFNRSDTQ